MMPLGYHSSNSLLIHGFGVSHCAYVVMGVLFSDVNKVFHHNTLANHHSSKLKCLSKVLDLCCWHFSDKQINLKNITYLIKKYQKIKNNLKDHAYIFPFLICLINSCLLKDRNYFSQNLRRPVSLPGHLCTQERTVSQK